MNGQLQSKTYKAFAKYEWQEHVPLLIYGADHFRLSYTDTIKLSYLSETCSPARSTRCYREETGMSSSKPGQEARHRGFSSASDITNNRDVIIMPPGCTPIRIHWTGGRPVVSTVHTIRSLTSNDGLNRGTEHVDNRYNRQQRPHSVGTSYIPRLR